MQKRLLKNITIDGVVYEKFYIFVDDNEELLVLPTAFSYFTISKGTWVYVTSKKDGEQYEERTLNAISDNTYINYLSALTAFLDYFNQNIKQYDDININLQESHRCDPKLIHYYINEVLPKKGFTTQYLDKTVSALKAYFNFLTYLKIIPPMDFHVRRKVRAAVAQNENKPKTEKYISRAHRVQLRNLCETECDELVLRMGFEVGLRTAENQGILLKQQIPKTKEEGGLLALFEELEAKPYQHTFKYWLHGKWTKGSSSRWIYFSRELLADMKKYYCGDDKVGNYVGEREVCWTEAKRKAEESGGEYKEPNAFFLQKNGSPFRKYTATDRFSKLKEDAPFLSLNTTYHDCRHTFATELYHSKRYKNGKLVGSEDAILFVVGERLGHRPYRGKPSSSTKIYIRLCDEMLQIEEFSYE